MPEWRVEAAELFQQAERASKSLEREVWHDAALERLRSDCLAFFDAVPEPPLYRRAEDPLRASARELLEKGQLLYARCLAASRLRSDEPSTAHLGEVLGAYLESLCHVAEGRLAAAEPAYARAKELDRAANRSAQLWSLSDEQPLPVYDRASGRSRYDPREPSRVQVKLACPNATCRATGEYAFAPEHAVQTFTCVRCRTDFVAYFAFVREVSRDGRHWTFRLDEPSGGASRLEMTDPAGAELSVARRDFLAFLYRPDKQLLGVLNLSTGRVLWLSRSGPCFLATSVFGEGAAELEAFRRFRDEVLLPSTLGAALLHGYYSVGPAASQFVERRPWLKRLVRRLLGRVHRALVKRGY